MVVQLVRSLEPKGSFHKVSQIGKLPTISFVTALLLGGCHSAKTTTFEKLPDVPATKVSAEDLAASFKEGEEAGQAKFGQRSLLVTGTIRYIKTGLNDVPYIQFSGTEGLVGPTAMFAESSPPKDHSLVSGAKVTVLCTGINLVMDVPVLHECARQ